MYYEVAKCQTLRNGETGEYYLLVHCWLAEVHMEIGLPPFLTEDFIIQRRVVGQRIVTNAQGFYKTATGQFVDPANIPVPQPRWAYETYTVDLRIEFRAIVESTLKGLLDAGWHGDKTGDGNKKLYRYGREIPKSKRAKPKEGDGVEIAAIRPLARELVLV